MQILNGNQMLKFCGDGPAKEPPTTIKRSLLEAVFFLLLELEYSNKTNNPHASLSKRSMRIIFIWKMLIILIRGLTITKNVRYYDTYLFGIERLWIN